MYYNNYTIDKELQRAVANGQLEKVKSLVEVGANIHAGDIFGIKPIHTAAAYGRKDMIEFFLKQGVSIDATDKNGRTALHYAVINGQLEIAKSLVAKGANINAADKNGWTALHYAAEYGYFETAEVLVDQGANVNAKNNLDEKPIDLANKNNHSIIVGLFVMHEYTQNDQLSAANLAQPSGIIGQCDESNIPSADATLDSADVPQCNNNASIAIATLVLVAVATIAISVYLEMLMAGVAVGAGCLVAAAVVCYTSRPASLVHDSSTVQAAAKLDNEKELII